MLEIGCGEDGGLVHLLADAGYEVLGVDPHAPDGEHFVRGRFQDIDGRWDAAVAGRVLHHVQPLGESLDLLAGFAPLLLVDEFGADLIDGRAQDWYEGQRRTLRASGAPVEGPESIDEWRSKHPHLHPHDVLLAALRERYDELTLERVPYLHRWLRGPSSEALEQSLVDAGALPAIGYRWAGARRSTTRSEAPSR